MIRPRLRESIADYREYGLPDELAMALAEAAVAASGLGQSEIARQHPQEALRITTESQIVGSLVHVLPIVGLFLARVSTPVRAVEAYALALGYGHVANSRWFEDVVGKHITAAAAALPPEVITAAEERKKTRNLWETAIKLIEAFAEHCRV